MPAALQIFIHGTGQNTNYFRNSNPDFTRQMAQSYQQNGYQVYQSNYDWSKDAGMLNQPTDRARAAEGLISLVDKQLGNLQRSGKLPKEMRLSLVGHSHGGNVAIQSLYQMDELAQKYGIKLTVDLVTINTPVYESSRTADTIRNGYNTEDPRAYKAEEEQNGRVKINHLHGSVVGDTVTFGALGLKRGGPNNKYQGGVTANVQYPDTRGNWINSIRESFSGGVIPNLSNGFNQHYAIVSNPELTTRFANTLGTFVQNRPLLQNQTANTLRPGM